MQCANATTMVLCRRLCSARAARAAVRRRRRARRARRCATALRSCAARAPPRARRAARAHANGWLHRVTQIAPRRAQRTTPRLTDCAAADCRCCAQCQRRLPPTLLTVRVVRCRRAAARAAALRNAAPLPPPREMRTRIAMPRAPRAAARLRLLRRALRCAAAARAAAALRALRLVRRAARARARAAATLPSVVATLAAAAAAYAAVPPPPRCAAAPRQRRRQCRRSVTRSVGAALPPHRLVHTADCRRAPPPPHQIV